jgi:hypothetical protein
MWEEFKAYYEAVKSIPSPIPFPCTIADWWNHLEQTINKNTANWIDDIVSGDPKLQKEYGIAGLNYRPEFFSVYYDLEKVYCNSTYQTQTQSSMRKSTVKIATPSYNFTNYLDDMRTVFVNEINGVPFIVQNGVPMAQPQQTAV